MAWVHVQHLLQEVNEKLVCQPTSASVVEAFFQSLKKWPNTAAEELILFDQNFLIVAT